MISILLPTRKRPRNIERLMHSIKATTVGECEVLAYIDADDDSEQIKDVHYVQGPRIVLSQCFNECYKHATGDIVMFCSDDVAFRTKKWDEQVIAAFPEDKIAFVHGDDGVNGDRFGTHGFLSRTWVDKVGYVLPPYFSADYSDNWVNALADSIGRRIYIPAMFEHLHPSLGKAAVDQTFQETRERYARDKVAQKYDELEAVRTLDSEKLKDVIKEKRNEQQNQSSGWSSRYGTSKLL